MAKKTHEECLKLQLALPLLILITQLAGSHCPLAFSHVWREELWPKACREAGLIESKGHSHTQETRAGELERKIKCNKLRQTENASLTPNKLRETENEEKPKCKKDAKR